MLYPLSFDPVLKSYIWGGRNLATRLGRSLPPDETIAESWEIAAHPNGVSVVNNGPLTGRPLDELVNVLGEALVGTDGAWALERGKFPLLIKLLDAAQMLSVQVHPNDAYAQAHEGNELGKSEMWVVLHAEPDAAIILGVKAGTTREGFRRAIEAGRLEDHLHRLPVRAGDHVCVPAGSLHAILGRALIAEIQQNSDTTYRVYDWGRRDKDGRARPLHIEQALEVINFAQVEPQLPAPEPVTQTAGLSVERLCANEYFIVDRVHMDAGYVYEGLCQGQTCEIWGTVTGRAEINADDTGMSVYLPAVQFTLLPAAMGSYTLRSPQPATLLHVYLPGNGNLKRPVAQHPPYAG